MYRKEKTLYTKCPPSILRKRSPMNQALSEKRRAERRVRFQEQDEIIRHDVSCCDYIVAHKRPGSVLPLFLGILLCLGLLLTLSLYCSSTRQDFKVLEDVQSRLVIVSVQIRHVALKWWTWFMRQ
ncbi:nutritionally-regulated adipose and cardiac enriched protein homolog [Heteronotia binoei]|uniref:nutritionally-regulated adipose and cardiac enriched protein homolog n=1 Tax=Heteronotia binoei TaxID=13085 RepID=UPI002931DE45|nr:nutritionally-regulated adipose and cardiac enriched protein homolog [Heteronotia binoei]